LLANLRAASGRDGTVLSSFRLGSGVTVWVVTQLGRRVEPHTTLMLPREYSQRGLGGQAVHAAPCQAVV
jgi:hypothetical protein